MAVSFRLRVDPLPGKSTRQHFFGVTAPFEDEAAVLEVLERHDLSITRAVATVLRSPRRPENECWFAILHDWPEDVRAFGVHRLRSLLCGEGWADRSELP